MIKSLSKTAEELINFCLSEGRICPKRKAWDMLNDLIRGTIPYPSRNQHREGIPVITPESPFAEKYQKSLQLRILISLADHKKQIELIDRLIRSFAKDEWHYFGDSRKPI